MWELIRANKRKSIILFFCMGICLLLLGYLIGAAFYPKSGGIIGISVAAGLWFIMSLVSYFSGDSIILTMSGAREVTPEIHPQLFNIVEEMKIAANLPAMPRVYIIDDPAPNAFATGTKPNKCAIAVTAGLLSRLNRDELQGVVAHELSHIINRDVLFVTFAGVLLGSIVLISQVFLRSMWYSSGSSKRYRSSGKSGGQAQLIIWAVAIVFAILAPIFAQLLYFALSRKREYLADASGARLTRYPEGLASALEKISRTHLNLASANKATAPMYIINPIKKLGAIGLSDMTSTHPPTSERIRILRSISQGVNYSNYQKAFSAIKGGISPIIPASGIKDSKVIPIRKASVEPNQEHNKKKDAREIGDLIRAVNKFAFLVCACGLKIKIPPDFNKPRINCPRCRRDIEVPLGELAAIAAVGAVIPEDTKQKQANLEPLTYKRKGAGWESVTCSCGRLRQISPKFLGSRIICNDCGRKINIVN
ncbi:MAG: M48 family metallopeptidase [Candidatus Omnitrophica bacterium]|nr:M48 family metallopeptidase [Candidatus Omnitrophota bacterium]MBU1631437.1 M48 family metallopeptidase [Candidatus Omnitrophota bacterium]MBU1889832.1 M48 family metallopeptidase [Candidatus Omnitrophota bacterium]